MSSYTTFLSRRRDQQALAEGGKSDGRGASGTETGITNFHKVEGAKVVHWCYVATCPYPT